jgi:polysaccharide pyruvyl transferase WcaK-like protein
MACDDSEGIPMTKVALLNYTGNRDNWGCQATSRGLVSFLQDSVLVARGCSLATIAYPHKHWFDDHVSAIHGDRLRHIFAQPSPGRDDLQFLESLARERFGSRFDEAKEADVVIFQGEGSIGPSYQYRSVRLFALPFLAKQLWGRRVFALNQTLYANNVEDGAVLANIMNGFDLVAVREVMSLRFALAAGIRRPVLCPDLAFRDYRTAGRPPVGAVPAIPSVPYFCVTGSAAIKQYSLEAFASLVREIAVTHAMTPVLLSSTKKDIDFSNRVATSLGDLGCRSLHSRDYPDVASIYPVLSHAAFVIGGRYHTVVSALALATPAIILPANTSKCEGLGPMLGMDIPVCDPSDRQQILAQVAHAVHRREDIARQLRQKRQTFEVIFQGFAGCLGALIEGNEPDWASLRQEPQWQTAPITIAEANQRIYDSHNHAEELSQGGLGRLRMAAELFGARRLGLLGRSIDRSFETGAS